MASLDPVYPQIRGQSSPAAAIIAIAGRQHGVISRSQLIAAGIAGSSIDRWVRSGRLHCLFRGVFAVGLPTVSREGRWMAAVLACGDGGGLFGPSAGELHGLLKPAGYGLHVVLPRHQKRSPTGLIVHRPRDLDPIDLSRRRGIPTTTATRTLFDLASSLTANALRDAFDQAVYLHLLNRPRLHVLLTGATGRRGLGTLRTLLTEAPLPLSETRSKLERLILRICRAHNLPIPAVNVPLLGYEVDFLWPAARFVIEADGGQHRGPQRDNDNERDVACGRAGLLVRRYSGEALEDEPAVGAEILEILLERLARFA